MEGKGKTALKHLEAAGIDQLAYVQQQISLGVNPWKDAAPDHEAVAQAIAAAASVQEEDVNFEDTPAREEPQRP